MANVLIVRSVPLQFLERREQSHAEGVADRLLHALLVGEVFVRLPPRPASVEHVRHVFEAMMVKGITILARYIKRWRDTRLVSVVNVAFKVSEAGTAPNVV